MDRWQDCPLTCEHFTPNSSATRAPAKPVKPPPVASSNGLVWEDPPSARRSSQFAEILDLIPQLRRNPGKWARLYTWRNKSGANGVQTRLRKMPELADCEFVARTVDGTKSALYGRYTGE